MRLQGIPHQTGFSMIELMVALVLGVILTSGVISVFISSKNTYNTNNSLGEVEESGRYALNFMQPVLTLAGNTGCERPGTSKQDLGTVPYIGTAISTAAVGSLPDYTPLYNFGLPVFGYEANGTGINATIPSNGGETVTSGTESYSNPDTNPADWTPALNWKDAPSNGLWVALDGSILQYSDVLMVHEALAQPVSVTSVDASSVYVTPSSVTNVPYTAANFTQNSFAIVSQCSNLGATSFQITAVTPSTGALGYSGAASPGNGGATGLTSVGTTYTVQPATTYVYYVGQGQDKWPALFEAYLPTSGGNAGKLITQELVSGVENMQVLYGVDIDKDQVPNSFETAAQVQNDDGSSGNGGGNWGNVVAVRVALVLQSDNYSVDKASASSTNVYMLGSGRTYTDNTILTTPQDQRLRRVFVETFSFRSMLP